MSKETDDFTDWLNTPDEAAFAAPICSGLGWTSDKPTEPGWYWVRGNGRPQYRQRIVEFERDDKGRLFCAWDFPIYCGPYEWAGPIPSPNVEAWRGADNDQKQEPK